MESDGTANELTIDPESRLVRTIGRVVGAVAPGPVPMAEPGTRLVEDLGFHSLALVELAFLLEELFALGTISNEDAARIQTVGDIITYVTRTSGANLVVPDEARVTELLSDFVIE